MLIAPNSPVPDLPSPDSRVRDVLALGLTQRNGGCPVPSPDLTVPLPVGAQIAQAQQAAAVVLQSNASSLTPAINGAGGSGATFTADDFAGAPQVQPFNVTPEMVAQSSPTILRQRKNRRRQAAAQTSVRSPGANWGQMPAVQPGSSCGPSAGTFLWQLKANPLAALLITSGLGVIVYAAVKK